MACFGYRPTIASVLSLHCPPPAAFRCRREVGGPGILPLTNHHPFRHSSGLPPPSRRPDPHPAPHSACRSRRTSSSYCPFWFVISHPMPLVPSVVGSLYDPQKAHRASTATSDLHRLGFPRRPDPSPGCRSFEAWHLSSPQLVLVRSFKKLCAPTPAAEIFILAPWGLRLVS